MRQTKVDHKLALLGLQLDAAPKGKERKSAQTLLERAEAKLSKYRSRLSAMHSSETVPKVEVGCLEEVISRMEADADGEWGSVMFIPAGNLSIYCIGYQWFTAIQWAADHLFCKQPPLLAA